MVGDYRLYLGNNEGKFRKHGEFSAGHVLLAVDTCGAGTRIWDVGSKRVGFHIVTKRGIAKGQYIDAWGGDGGSALGRSMLQNIHRFSEQVVSQERCITKNAKRIWYRGANGFEREAYLRLMDTVEVFQPIESEGVRLQIWHAETHGISSQERIFITVHRSPGTDMRCVASIYMYVRGKYRLLKRIHGKGLIEKPDVFMHKPKNANRRLQFIRFNDRISGTGYLNDDYIFYIKSDHNLGKVMIVKARDAYKVHLAANEFIAKGAQSVFTHDDARFTLYIWKTGDSNASPSGGKLSGTYEFIQEDDRVIMRPATYRRHLPKKKIAPTEFKNTAYFTVRCTDSFKHRYPRLESPYDLSKEPLEKLVSVVNDNKSRIVTITRTDGVKVPYDKARANLVVAGGDREPITATVADFRTIDAKWIDENLLFLDINIGHIASIHCVLDTHAGTWVYRKSLSYVERSTEEDK